MRQKPLPPEKGSGRKRGKTPQPVQQSPAQILAFEGGGWENDVWKGLRGKGQRAKRPKTLPQRVPVRQKRGGSGWTRDKKGRGCARATEGKGWVELQKDRKKLAGKWTNNNQEF